MQTQQLTKKKPTQTDNPPTHRDQLHATYTRVGDAILKTNQPATNSNTDNKENPRHHPTLSPTATHTEPHSEINTATARANVAKPSSTG